MPAGGQHAFGHARPIPALAPVTIAVFMRVSSRSSASGAAGTFRSSIPSAACGFDSM
jgi:hypothetical protein